MIGRNVLVGLIVFLVAVPATFVGFAMALVVVELVIFPTMTLIVAVVTALVASWTADPLTADGLHTDLNQTVGRNLGWALIVHGYEHDAGGEAHAVLCARRHQDSQPRPVRSILCGPGVASVR